MPEDSLFNDLKDSLEQSKEVSVEANGQFRAIHRLLVISDDFDDYTERYNLAYQLAERLGAKVSKIFLYDIETFLQAQYSVEQVKESDKAFIELLRQHSAHLKELKEIQVKIILDDTVRELLFSLRDVRQAEQMDDLKMSEFEALTDFFLANHSREQNFANSVIDYIGEFKPQLIYFKPPLLRARDGQVASELSLVTQHLLKCKPNGSWVFLRGKVSLRSVKDARLLIIGGQDISDIMHSVQSAISVFPDSSKVNFKYLILFDKKKVNLASMVSETDSTEELRRMLKQKAENRINHIRINDSKLTGDVIFGEVETHLPAFLDESKTELVFVSPKVTTKNQFDDEVMNSLFEIVRIGISVLVSY